MCKRAQFYSMDNDTHIHVNTLIKNIKNSSYVEYETSLLTEYIDARPYTMSVYSKMIFDECIEYFERQKIGRDAKRIAPKDKLIKLFNFLFKNTDNKINNISKLVYFSSGCDIIESYVHNRGTFGEDATRMLMQAIGNSLNPEITDTIIQLFNEHDVFAFTEDLVEYAAYIPLNKYVYRAIEQNTKITKECYYNIIKYSNDVELCQKVVEIGLALDSVCLNYAFESKNKDIITYVLNNKVKPKSDVFRAIFYKREPDIQNAYKFKEHNIDPNEYVYLYFESDKYNDTGCLMRVTYRDKYTTIDNMISILEQSGYKFSYDDFFTCLENGVLLGSFDFDFGDSEMISKYTNICARIGFYPYFVNKKKYPMPTVDCLYKECGKKNNMKIIKQLVQCLKLSGTELFNAKKIANDVKNNHHVIKFLNSL